MKRTLYPLAHKQPSWQPSSFFKETVLKNCYLAEFSKNEFVVHEGSSLTYLYFILEGKAKILKTQTNGRQSILQFLGPGDFIGELTLLEAETVAKAIIALGPLCCLAVPLTYAETELMTDPVFLKMLAKHVGEKLLKRMEHLAALQTLELKYRLAALLLESSIDGEYNQKHTQIADYLGVSYRHLLYTFKFFKEEGYLKQKGRVFEINEAKLTALLAAEVDH